MGVNDHSIPKNNNTGFQNLVDEIPIGIFTCDKKGYITAINDFLLDMLGSPSAEATRNINILTSPPFIGSGISGVLSEALLTGKNTSIETHYTSIWGKELFLNFRAFPLKDENGTTYSCHAIVEDVASKKRDYTDINSDISEHKKPEEVLCQNESDLKQTLNAVYDSNDNLEKMELRDILDYEILQLLFEEFYQLTGFLIGIGDLQGNTLVAVGLQDICTKFHRVNPETCAYCTESDLELCRGLKPNEYKLYKCKNGLWDAITPIFIDGVHLGNFYYGQFLLDDEEIPYDTFQARAKKYGFDEEKYMQALDKVPFVSRKKVETIMAFYNRLTQLISSLSHSNIKLARTLKERDLLLTSLQESEKRFRSYVEQAPDAMFIADEMGNLIEVNEAACRLTGYSKEEIAGMKLINISVDLENVQSQFRSLVESGSAFDEWDILTKSGDKRITSVKAVKLSEKRFLGFARDITERKMAENALVISENNFKSLFDLTTVGVAQVAPDGSFMRINKHFSDILGYSIDELSRMNFADITHPDDLSLDMEYAEECVAGIIDSYEIEKRYIHKNGDIIWARLSVKVVRDAKNVGVYAISVITDFTEKKKAEMALEENKAFLNEVETIAKIGGWELDVGSGNMVLEPEIRSIYEFNDSEDACIEEFLNFHTNSSRGLIEKQINCASENAEAFDIEAELITARGKHKCVRIIARPLIKNKAVEKFVGAIQDITLRKKAIQELEHNEQKYRTLFEQSNDAIIIHDTNGNIIDVNQMACDLFGYSQDELKQKSIIDLIAPEEIEKITAEFINIFTTGSSRQETKMIRPDGTVIYVDVNATLLKNQGNLVQAVGRDITDRIKAKNAMQNAKIEAETANRTKSEFLANMSHELRTPLNSIIGFSDIMLDGIVGELELKQEHYLQNISDSGKHLLDLINSILDISKIEAGKMDLYYEEINAERTAYEIISMMQTLTTKKNIVVDVHVPDGLPMINADRSKIKQVLYNLLGNAIKFTDNKGNITIHAAVENRKMQISVIDTGIGISHDDQKKLFKPFSQIDSSTSRKYAGTGLGLALVKDIVELHGGRIWVESEVGEGSNFTFEIPIDKVARTD